MVYHMTDLKQFPLRERKKAITRLAILDAVINRLTGKLLSDITIEEICEDVQISRGTFFQYFPQKTDVLVFYGLLWNLEAMWTATCSPDVSSGINAIEQMFKTLSHQVETHPRLWMEILSIRALQPEKFAKMGTRETDQISEIERLIRFPELPGIESIPEGNFRQFFLYNLHAAVDKKELPETTEIENAFLSLACIFYGIPLMSFDKSPVRCSSAFDNQLDLLWKGLKAKVT
jgi:AcrR family transcriptional regulator